MNDIFISYDRSDRAIAQKFADALEALGWSVWWDREIPLGKSFDQVIEEELNAARCVVVLWSKESVLSRWVKTEASTAAERDRLAPVLIDQVTIPLEFRRIQSAELWDWDGDTANPEFTRLVDAVKGMLGRSEARPETAALPRKIPDRVVKPAARRGVQPRSLGLLAAVVVLIIVVRLMFGGKAAEEGASPPSTPGAGSDSLSSAVPSAVPDPARPGAAVLPPPGAFSIKIGDKIDDGVPVSGAGIIEKPYAQDAYVFSAEPRQNVYFRMLRYSPGLSYIKWRLVDEAGMEVFNMCLGCTEPGVQSLIRGGRYILTVGSTDDPSIGSYQLQLFNVPAPARLPVKIGEAIAGAIESPGAENIYTFTANPRQRVYFAMREHSPGLSYIKWRLVDDNGMEQFNVCLGCTDPGVQTLIKGGAYTLTLGNRTDPSTGNYRLQLSDVPPANQFAIKIGDRVQPGAPGPGAGVIEGPGGEDVYVFNASPGQQAIFHLLQNSKGMEYIKWRLVDENGMELFSSCLGCSPPAVALTKGGRYTLTVSNSTDPTTGNYSFEINTR